MMTRLFFLMALLLTLSTGLGGCFSDAPKDPKHPDKATAPAAIENPVPENQLTTITLTPEAEKRLGIQLATPQRQSITQSLTQHGEILAVPGFTVTVTAPLNGKISGPRLTAGQRVQNAQALFEITALPNDSSGLGAEQDVTLRRQQLALAQAQLHRYEQLSPEQLVSQRLLQESRVNLVTAETALNAAQARQRFLAGQSLPADQDSLSTMRIQAPLSGVIQKLYGTPGQLVSAGTPLLDLASLSTVWVRVPVYSGDLASVQEAETATVSPLGARDSRSGRVARSVSGPPTTSPNAISTDVFFELSNEDEAFQIGQKVSVSILQAEQPADQRNHLTGLTIPASAIVMDMDGGYWVYQKTAPQTYVRRRVAITRTRHGRSMLATPLPENVPLVSVGAAELFGTEFGAGK